MVSGPILFTIYTLPLGDIFRKYQIGFHLYADDTQIYLSCDPNSIDEDISRIEACINEFDHGLQQTSSVLMTQKLRFCCLDPKVSIKRLVLFLSKLVISNYQFKCYGVITNYTVTFSPHARNIGAIITDYGQ